MLNMIILQLLLKKRMIATKDEYLFKLIYILIVKCREYGVILKLL